MNKQYHTQYHYQNMYNVVQTHFVFLFRLVFSGKPPAAHGRIHFFCHFARFEKGNSKNTRKRFCVLKEGAAADVIVIDYDPLTPMNESNINGHLMFGVNGSMVQTTVCNGKVLMKDREVLVCDEAKVMADCRQAAKELADDING